MNWIPNMMLQFLPRTQKSRARAQRKAERRHGPLRLITSRLPLPCEKRSALGGGCFSFVIQYYIRRHLKSSVVCCHDGKDGRIETWKSWPSFSNIKAMPAKITPLKLLWLVLTNEICLLFFSKLYRSILFVVIKGTKKWLQHVIDQFRIKNYRWIQTRSHRVSLDVK